MIILDRCFPTILLKNREYREEEEEEEEKRGMMQQTSKNLFMKSMYIYIQPQCNRTDSTTYTLLLNHQVLSGAWQLPGFRSTPMNKVQVDGVLVDFK